MSAATSPVETDHAPRTGKDRRRASEMLRGHADALLEEIDAVHSVFMTQFNDKADHEARTAMREALMGLYEEVHYLRGEAEIFEEIEAAEDVAAQKGGE